MRLQKHETRLTLLTVNVQRGLSVISLPRRQAGDLLQYQLCSLLNAFKSQPHAQKVAWQESACLLYLV
jgi:hypothetical protein